METYDKDYLIYDPATYMVTGLPVEKINAARLSLAVTANVLIFLNNKNQQIALHNLSPGHSIMALDRDGNETTL